MNDKLKAALHVEDNSLCDDVAGILGIPPEYVSDDPWVRYRAFRRDVITDVSLDHLERRLRLAALTRRQLKEYHATGYAPYDRRAAIRTTFSCDTPFLMSLEEQNPSRFAAALQRSGPLRTAVLAGDAAALEAEKAKLLAWADDYMTAPLADDGTPAVDQYMSRVTELADVKFVLTTCLRLTYAYRAWRNPPSRF